MVIKRKNYISTTVFSRKNKLELQATGFGDRHIFYNGLITSIVIALFVKKRSKIAR